METSPTKKIKDLKQGEDYYTENGLFVFTEKFLTERGYCCQSGCRHCPYNFQGKESSTISGRFTV